MKFPLEDTNDDDIESIHLFGIPSTQSEAYNGLKEANLPAEAPNDTRSIIGLNLSQISPTQSSCLGQHSLRCQVLGMA